MIHHNRALLWGYLDLYYNFGFALAFDKKQLSFIHKISHECMCIISFEERRTSCRCKYILSVCRSIWLLRFDKGSVVACRII